MLTLKARPRIGCHSAKQNNTLVRVTLLVIRVVRVRSPEMSRLIGTHCVRNYRVY